MDYERFTFTCPASIPNKIAVIKAIRSLTGLGLKEAKDASERCGPQTMEIKLQNSGGFISTERAIEDYFRELRANGVEVAESAFMILEGLRKLGAEALKQGEDELANEILQLVLAEKLRRKK